jgi:hypothetical protein
VSAPNERKERNERKSGALSTFFHWNGPKHSCV